MIRNITPLEQQLHDVPMVTRYFNSCVGLPDNVISLLSAFNSVIQLLCYLWLHACLVLMLPSSKSLGMRLAMRNAALAFDKIDALPATTIEGDSLRKSDTKGSAA